VNVLHQAAHHGDQTGRRRQRTSFTIFLYYYTEERVMPGPHLRSFLHCTMGKPSWMADNNLLLHQLINAPRSFLILLCKGGSHPHEIPRFKIESLSLRRAVLRTFLNSTPPDVNHVPYTGPSCTTLLLPFSNFGPGAFAYFLVLGPTTCFFLFCAPPFFRIFGPWESSLGVI